MNLSDFIDKLFNRYKCTAPDIDDKKEELTSVLVAKCGKIDFQKLLDLIAREHDGDFLPNASSVLGWSKRCYKNDYVNTNKEWIQVKIYNPIYKTVMSNDCFPAGTSEETILKWYKKRFGGDGWKVLEVY